MLQGSFPRAHTIPEEFIEVVKEVFPGIKLNKIKVYSSLPWFMALSHKPFDAATIPSGVSNFSIYHNHFVLTNPHHLSILFHEFFHAWDFQKRGNAGLGLCKVFVIFYLADYFIHGYRNNIYERPAYLVQEVFYKYLILYSHDISKLKSEGLEDLKREIEFILRDLFKRKVPFITLIPAFFLTLLLSLLHPILSLILRILNVRFLKNWSH